MSLSEDASVAVCLCTRLGRGEATEPLCVEEWTELVVALHGRSATPRDLLDADAPERTPRLEELLRGLGSVGIELERLESMGIWILTRGDEQYPRAWKKSLGASAPVVLFGAGSRAAFERTSLAILCSRKTDEQDLAFARDLAERCELHGWSVVGHEGAVRVLGGGLERAIAKKSTREAILAGELTLVTPYLPSDGYTNDRAKACNRLVYALCAKACVVSTGGHSGVTAHGAREALRENLTSVWTRSGEAALIREGAMTIREPLGSTLSEILPDANKQGEFGF